MRPLTEERGEADPVVRARLQALAAQARQGRPPGLDEWDEALPEEPPEQRVMPSSDLVRKVRAFGRDHAVVLGLVALVAVAAACLGMLRARAVPLDMTVGGPPATPLAASGSLSTNTGPPPTVSPSSVAYLVHVVGAVKRPGVVAVPAGGRVQDAIARAGGFKPNADPAQLNLAAPVVDGSQIVVAVRGRPAGQVAVPATTGAGSGGASVGASVNLNTATLEQLDQLPGVGPVTAQHILDWRAQHQRFNRTEELQEVDGIGPKTYAQLAPHVHV